MFVKVIRSVSLAAVAALLFAAPQAANAYWPFGFYGGGGYGYGFGAWNNPSYWNGGIYASPLPYYAQFPPVYYSHQITARHYGASPYAWYAGQEPITYVPMAEPRSEAAPLMVVNPYVPGAKPATAQIGTPESTPVSIDNPFVASNSR
jgi:hypothetical protein